MFVSLIVCGIVSLSFTGANLPPCGQSQPGQVCTSNGRMISVSCDEAKKACQDSFSECGNRQINNATCANQLSDCMKKVENGDRSPDVGYETFGYTLGGGPLPSQNMQPEGNGNVDQGQGLSDVVDSQGQAANQTGQEVEIVSQDQDAAAQDTQDQDAAAQDTQDQDAAAQDTQDQDAAAQDIQDDVLITPIGNGTAEGDASTSYENQFEEIQGGKTGTARTTRYWDCCKPTCSWPQNIQGIAQGTVAQCDKDGKPLSGPVDAQSMCDGGPSAACFDQTPFVNPDEPNLAFGFAAVNQAGECCKCFELTFTTVPGKRMVIQVTNTGEDVEFGNQFDIAIPGGGEGRNPQGCQNQFGVDPSGQSLYSGGGTHGGVANKDGCSGLPESLQAACHFRFDFWGPDPEQNSNPPVSYREVKCPAVLTSRTGCTRI